MYSHQSVLLQFQEASLSENLILIKNQYINARCDVYVSFKLQLSNCIFPLHIFSTRTFSSRRIPTLNGTNCRLHLCVHYRHVLQTTARWLHRLLPCWGRRTSKAQIKIEPLEMSRHHSRTARALGSSSSQPLTKWAASQAS